MPRRVTIADVAREAGVSSTTVSHALSGLGRVDPRTRERVRAVVARLGYRPSVRAQRLRRGQSRTIALLSSMPAAVAGGQSRLGFYMEVAGAAAEASLGGGFALVLVPPLESGVPWDSLDIDGAVVVEPCAADELTSALLERGVAVVCLGRQPDAELPHVDLRGAATAELLLDHLHRQGARRIGLLVGETARHSYLAARDAYQGFTRERGLCALVVDAPEGGGEQAGYQACRRLLEADPKLDAVCAMVDAFAVGALRALAEAGRRVPEDVLVVTRYDGVRARTSVPALTAVDLHLGEVASAAVRLLLAHIAGDDADQVVVGPAPSLVVRASSVRASSVRASSVRASSVRGPSVRGPLS